MTTSKEKRALPRVRCGQVSLFVLGAVLMTVSLACFLTGKACAAADEAVEMIVELVSGSDNDMRMLAIQQIREAVPGEEATRRFVKLLEKLSPEVQVMLIDALGERGDIAARPAILKLLDSKSEDIRVVAARAMSRLAIPADVEVLARIAATGSEAEKQAARYSLRQLRGSEMNVAMIDTLKNADSKQKVELIGALVARSVKESLAAVVKSVDDPDVAARLAVLDAMRAMAGEEYTAVVVERVRSADSQSERRRAGAALVAICGRGRIKCADTVIAALDGADATARVLLMRALLLAGGEKSLKEIVGRLKDDDKSVRAEAVRVLADWREPAAIPFLKVLARDKENLRDHVLAMRGIVRLAGPGKDRKADLATLSEAMALATRKDERVLVLGVLGTIPALESLDMVASCLDDPEIAEDAALAAVLIAEKITSDDNNKVRAVMQKVSETAADDKTRDRAKKVLEAERLPASK